MTTPGATSSSIPPRQDDTATMRRGPVLLAIALTILLAAGTVALLLHASLTTPPTQHVLVVRSSAGWEGVELIVEGDALDEPKVGTIDKLGNYVVPFFLPAGEYTLRVLDHGEQIYLARVNLNAQQVEIDLTRKGVATRPSTQSTSRPG